MDVSIANIVLLTMGVLSAVVLAVVLILHYSSSKTLMQESAEHVTETTSRFSMVEYQPYDDVVLKGSDVRYVIEKYGSSNTSLEESEDEFFVAVSPCSNRLYVQESDFIGPERFRKYLFIGKHENLTDNSKIKKFSYGTGTGYYLSAVYIDTQARYRSYVLTRNEGTNDTIMLEGATYHVPDNYKVGSCTSSTEQICGIWLVEY